MTYAGILLKRTARVAACLLTLASLTSPARADDLDDFNRTVEAAMVHRRAAADYLRQDNIAAAQPELEAMRETWGKVSLLRRPAAFRNQERYTGVMLDVAARLIGTTLVLHLGRADVAQESLDAVRKSLADLRRENGVAVLADCVLDAGTDMTALSELGERTNFESGALAAIANGYRATLQRCDGMAPASIRNHVDFRDLIDGTLALLAQIPKAVKTRDESSLRRLLEGLREFDRRLASHYG